MIYRKVNIENRKKDNELIYRAAFGLKPKEDKRFCK